MKLLLFAKDLNKIRPVNIPLWMRREAHKVLLIFKELLVVYVLRGDGKSFSSVA